MKKKNQLEKSIKETLNFVQIIFPLLEFFLILCFFIGSFFDSVSNYSRLVINIPDYIKIINYNRIELISNLFNLIIFIHNNFIFSFCGIVWIVSGLYESLIFILFEFVCVQQKIETSIYFQYNVLFFFSLIIIQFGIVGIWDLIFYEQIFTLENLTTFSGIEYDNLNIAPYASLFTALLLFMLCLIYYFRLTIQIIFGKYPIILEALWISDSITHWLDIKTLTNEKSY
jgi:hypothetical protein